MASTASVLLLVLGLHHWCEHGTPPMTGNLTKAEPVAALIQRLGSASFREREAATQTLIEIGSPALEAVRQATESPDPEVRLRAVQIGQRIRQQIETVAFLEPKRVHLHFQELPVAAAVAEFAQATKYPIRLAALDSRLVGKRITLDTGEVPFWVAWDQFCKAAELTEQRPAISTDTVEDYRFRAAPMGRPGLLVDRATGRVVEQGPDARFELSPGTWKSYPTCVQGSVRFRALPSTPEPANSDRPVVGFRLEATPELQRTWLGILDVRLVRAIDEHGQSLAQSLDRDPGERIMPAAQDPVLQARAMGALVFDVQGIPIRLHPGAKVGQRLKEVQGVLSAQVLTPLRPVIALDHPLQHIGQQISGTNGETLKVLEAGPYGSDSIRLRLLLSDPHAWRLFGMPNRAQMMRRQMMLRGGLAPVPTAETGQEPATITLTDAKGQSLPLAGRTAETRIHSGRVQQDIILVYRTRNNAVAPERLAYSARRTVAIDVPFELREVPVR